ncbi:MAG: PEGA domain-containing protein [Lentisphaeria bacterium]|nr:PEGA domain-containing protein [Lentisphaeria bacterium]
MKNIFSYVLCVLLSGAMLAALPGCNKKRAAKNPVKVTFQGPEGMTMEFRGKALEGLTRKMLPGSYLLKFSAPGFKTAWKRVAISRADNNSNMNIELEPQRSVILVSCSVDASGRDANVTLSFDGVEKGTTPCLITGVQPGTHFLEFRHPGHASKSRKIEVANARPIPVIRERLNSNSGTLQVIGKPAGATLYINEEAVGSVPYQAKFTAGKYLLELRAPGHIDKKTEIEVIADKVVKSRLELDPEPSSLFIESVPTNAVCVIRGEKRGTTPIKVNNLMPGNYKVELSMPGFDTVEEMIEVKAGSHERIKVTLESGYGQARLNIRPAGVDVMVDGKSVGRTKKVPGSEDEVETIELNELKPGMHTCVISHPLARPRTQKKFTFRVSKNKTTDCPVMELWVPNCELTYRRNMKDNVKLIRLTDDEVEFELQPGIAVTERRNNVKIRYLNAR